MDTPKNPMSLNHRIRESLSRLAVVMRYDDWNRAKAVGLNPAQLSILETLRGREAGMGVKEIAVHFAVSQPSASDSIFALERKGLVEKRNGSDKRAVVVSLTPKGHSVLTSSLQEGTAFEQAISALVDNEQEELLLFLVKLIRDLQDVNAIPIQRMCATCRHFVPFKRADTGRPHHCNLADVSFGRGDIRIDCNEHKIADPKSQADACGPLGA
ncbi:MarR family winged helix-turn-helix transcriptional regulator [Rhizobium pusense]|uniref:MarR family winged helix-turn-helix transcriptional regulator n=1 Tax=Agrobacterium pusense TaxID=648995 RepID=UPI002449A574|nr:MarR family winged helix-turn-helix transcriptional regulator [Agrobacterium pusense]MDH0117659.1 MarR family winged helix-turn-helix transcriptional regulator [Agrobacterium pusense]